MIMIMIMMMMMIIIIIMAIITVFKCQMYLALLNVLIWDSVNK